MVGSGSPIDLAALSEDQRSHAPVQAVRVYVDRTASLRGSDQLFVSWAGKPITKQCLAHWVVQTIALACSSQGLQPPDGFHAHLTQGVTTS